MTASKFVVLTTALLMLVPCNARAQQQGFIKTNLTNFIRKIGVHANTSFRTPVDHDVTEGRTYGLSIGLSPGDSNGWRYPFALAFFNEHLNTPSGIRFARLRSRALVGGIGYGWHFGKLSTGAALQAGYAWYSLHGEGDVVDALELADGPVTMDVSDSWVLRPQIKAEYFLTRKLTVRVSGDYVLTHPEIVVVTPAGEISHRWDASNFHANVGIGVYPFHK